MGKRIFWLAIILAAVLCGFFYYRHHQEEVRLANGDVSCIGCMSPEERARFQRDSASPATDNSSDRQSGVKATSAVSKVGKEESGNVPASLPSGADQLVNSPPPVAPASTSSGLPADPVLNSGNGSTPPATDTIAPNPPNGMVFSGKGNYQWYRQGNLTWRVDTTNGHSCIIYATLEEWRKQIVYSHGCGHAA